MKYPDIKTYKKLYQRFLLGDRTKEMIDIAGDINNKIFLDICCGGGRLTTEALNKGVKKSIMVDAEEDMIDKSFILSGLTDVKIMDVHQAFKEIPNGIIDVAMCQQGINYWLTEHSASLLSLIMSKEGVFIFNTFNKKPPKIPKIKEYSIEENKYVEISWMGADFWDGVHHVQICEGLAPHHTRFKWMSETYFRNCLDKFFEIEIIRKNKTDIYKCIKKG